MDSYMHTNSLHPKGQIFNRSVWEGRGKDLKDGFIYPYKFIVPKD